MSINSQFLQSAALGKLFADSLLNEDTIRTIFGEKKQDTNQTRPFDVQAEFQKLKDAFAASRATTAKEVAPSIESILERLASGAELLRQGLQPKPDVTEEVSVEPTTPDTLGSRVFASMVSAPSLDDMSVVDSDPFNFESRERSPDEKLAFAVDTIYGLIENHVDSLPVSTMLTGQVQLLENFLLHKISNPVRNYH